MSPLDPDISQSPDTAHDTEGGDYLGLSTLYSPPTLECQHLSTSRRQ